MLRIIRNSRFDPLGGSGYRLVIHSPRVHPLRRMDPWQFMVRPAEGVLNTISSPFPWVAPMVIHKLDQPRLILHIHN
jgi:hypothetical protein